MSHLCVCAKYIFGMSVQLCEGVWVCESVYVTMCDSFMCVIASMSIYKYI